MLEIELINADLSSNANAHHKDAFECYCLVKLFNKEIGRTPNTHVVTDDTQAIFNYKLIMKDYHDFEDRDRMHNRPFYMETIELEMYDVLRGSERHLKVYETRIPLSFVGTFHSFKLLRPLGSDWKHESEKVGESCRIFVRINCLEEELQEIVQSFKPLELCKVLSPHIPQYRHLFMSFSWSEFSLTYRTGLPGPVCGERVIDRYGGVEWRSPGVSNCFGDRSSVTCFGSLWITDLRVIFLPETIIMPFSSEPILDIGSKTWEYPATIKTLSAEDILLIHRYTLELPIPSIVESRLTATDSTSKCHIVFSLIDDGTLEFIVTANLHSAIQRQRRGMVVGFGDLVESKIRQRAARLRDPHFSSGLDTDSVEPIVWVNRVVSFINFEKRVDIIWLRWAKYMMLSSKGVDPKVVKRFSAPMDLDADYSRLQPQDLNWRFSDLNSSYDLCSTYPSILVFPGLLTDEQIRSAASQRSAERLPALVWIHPATKAPLCRSAQPLSGISGLVNMDYDKRMCLAIKTSCPTNMPIRIADARPKMNANANAMQGKGFENIAFFGGASVASLAFLDIENIHVVRGSMAKVREALSVSYLASSGDLSSEATVSTYQGSKWVNHVSSVLRGAVGVAESLSLGHPVLVHCSDGWDRTSQLSMLAQLMLDPHYRTVEGFLMLIQKEWSAFGHKFEDRVGRSGLHKETSPVFIQALDAVWQIQQQFPTKFQFSSFFLHFIVQCVYSGYFTNFRGNCERERLLMQRNAVFEDLAPSEFEFSSLRFFILLLLETPSYSVMLLNANYVPPTPREVTLDYLRPRYSAVDLCCWREGLLGLNSNILDAVGKIGVACSPEDCASISTDFTRRYISYNRVHLGTTLAAHQSLQDNFELIEQTTYPCPGPNSLIRRLQLAENAHSFINGSLEFSLLRAATVSSACLDDEYRLYLLEIAAANKVKTWLRSLAMTKAALVEWRVDIGGVALGEADRERRTQAARSALWILASSRTRSQSRLRLDMQRSRSKHIYEIIDEIVLDVVNREARALYALKSVADLEASMSATAFTERIDTLSTDAKTLSSKIFSFSLTNKSSHSNTKSQATISEVDALTGEYAEIAGDAEDRGSTNSRHSGSSYTTTSSTSNHKGNTRSMSPVPNSSRSTNSNTISMRMFGGLIGK